MNIIDEDLSTGYLPLYFDQYINSMVAGIMKKMRYFLGIGLGKKLQGIGEPVKIATQRHSFGFGYKPTKKELRESERKSKGERRPYKRNLNGYFVKERDDFPFCDFSEPWVIRLTSV